MAGLVPALPIPGAAATVAAPAAPAAPAAAPVAGVLDALPPPAGPGAAEVFILLSYVWVSMSCPRNGEEARPRAARHGARGEGSWIMDAMSSCCSSVTSEKSGK